MSRGTVALLVAYLLMPREAARAQGIASPGPLASAHARYDDITRCLMCHEAGRELSGRKCLACHRSLAVRIAAGRGYHATATRRGAAPACGSCHSEHNGRPFRLVRWPDNQPRERFDHQQTGWTLDGAHARLRCEDCHRTGLIADAAARSDSSLSTTRTYLGLGTSCRSCHLDEHRGRVGSDCERCHTTVAWTPAPGFDHSRTRFPLTGRHRDVPCSGCHTERSQVESGPGGSRDTLFVDFRTARPAGGGCTGCHTSPHHEARRLGRCEACHTTDGWFSLPDSLRAFDHGRTQFQLRGAHTRAACERCHLSSLTAPLGPRVALVRPNLVRALMHQPMRFARCDDCHAGVHEGELGTAAAGRDCVACHDQERFSPTRFTLAMHDSTAFALTGAHAATPCMACHLPLPAAAPGSGRVRFRHPDLRCAACHRDPHGGELGARRCEDCHTTEAWSRVTFDHDATRYPLRGAHVRLACSRCHPGRGRETAGGAHFGSLPTDCAAAACHGDPHGGQFAGRTRGDACTVCHTEAAWRPAQFDHQRDSDWPLDGAHQSLACVRCHAAAGQPASVRYRGLPHRCQDCHR